MNGNISNIYCECSAVAKLYTYFSYIHTNEFVFHAGKLIVFFRLATNRRNINSAIVFQFQLWQNIIGINCQDKEHRVTMCHSARLIAVDNRNKRWMKNIALSITLVLFPSRMESILIAFAVHTPKNWSIFFLVENRLAASPWPAAASTNDTEMAKTKNGMKEKRKRGNATFDMWIQLKKFRTYII